MKAASLWLCNPVASTPDYRICMNIILILTDIFYLSMTDSLSVIVNLSNTESLLVTVNLSNTDSLPVTCPILSACLSLKICLSGVHCSGPATLPCQLSYCA